MPYECSPKTLFFGGGNKNTKKTLSIFAITIVVAALVITSTARIPESRNNIQSTPDLVDTDSTSIPLNGDTLLDRLRRVLNGELIDVDIADTADINPGKINGTAWTGFNDGDGSGLDADMVDGLEGDQFLRSDTADTMNGDLDIIGDLTVNGDPVAIGGVAFCAINTYSDSIGLGWYQVEFDSEYFDDGGNYNNNLDQFIAPSDGVYHFTTMVAINDVAFGTRHAVALDKNGVIKYYVDSGYNTGDNYNQYGGSMDLKLNAGDTITVMAFNNAALGTLYGVSTTSYTYFSGHRVY